MAIGCGSSPPPKAEPAPMMAASAASPSSTNLAQAGASATSSAAAGTASVAAPEPAAPQNAQSEPSPNPTTPEPKLFPIDVMTGRETAFLIDYANSGAVEVVKQSCAGKIEEDANKHEECLAKSREKFGADVLRFKKDDKGRIKFYIYRRSGSALAELYVSNVELKEIGPNQVRVEMKGGSSGQRPIMKTQANFDVKVPNGYSIELQDTQYGRLPYEAKVGLVAH
jgi:hypothetical protein